MWNAQIFSPTQRNGDFFKNIDLMTTYLATVNLVIKPHAAANKNKDRKA